MNAPPMGIRHAAILGGGLIGLASAWRLRQAGVEVTLVDSGAPGAAASQAAAGMLAPQLEATAPGPLLELCLRARREYGQFVSDLQSATGHTVGFREDGALKLALNATDAAALEQLVQWQRAEGLRAEWLTRSQRQTLEPSLSADLAAAAYFPDEGQVDNRRLLQALHEACALSHVRRISERATGVGRRGRSAGRPCVKFGERTLEADLVVVAAGAWSSLLDGDFEAARLIEPIRGQMLQYQLAVAPFRPILSCHDGYMVARADGRVLVGSTMERTGFESTVTHDGVQRLEKLAHALVPSLREHVPADSWAGLRPGTRDGLPLLGWAPQGDILFATGHFRNGVLLTDLTARLVTELVAEAPEPAWLQPFRPDRQLAPAA